MRRVKHVLTYVLVLSMCFTLFFFPVPVKAEDVPYGVLQYYSSTADGKANGTIIAHDSQYNTDLRVWNYTNVDTRYVLIENILYFFVNSSNTNSQPTCWRSNQAYGTSYNISTYTIEGINYYCARVTSPASFSGWTYSIENYSLSDFPDYTEPITLGYALTFGEYASGIPSGPTYGKPYNVEYSTRIAGSGLASADNIDRIVWNRAVDTNGNELPTGARVQIRAIPGKYVGNTANDVLTKSYTDFVLDHSKQLIIVDIIASRGVYETKWSEVVDHFGFFPYSWVPNIQYLDNEYFKMGWIYQIRLQVDNYYSDWTNIYTATGSGASESQTITDSDEISQQLVQDINIVNQLNNTTTTNWYINETTINNSEYTENSNGKPWWAYLLEAILSLFQIDDGNQQTINNTNNLNIDLNDKLNEYNEIEDQQLNNLDTNLEAIAVESDMLENNKFVGSANWVAQQYTRMTNGTVIGSLIGFSLLFGLALIFIGKIR